MPSLSSAPHEPPDAPNLAECGEPSSPEKALWAAFSNDKTSVALRNRLVEHYLPFVRQVARRLCKALPQMVEVENVEAYGVFGLIDAIGRFDPSSTWTFKQYAYRRVRGAMIDGLRQEHPLWYSRYDYKKRTLLAAECEELQQELQRAPTETERIERSGLPILDFARLQSSVYSLNTTPRVGLNREGDEDFYTLCDVLPDSAAPNPSDIDDALDVMRTALRGCSVRERLLMLGYYVRGKTMREVGTEIAVGEARVSQLHKQILARIRKRLRNGEVSF